MTDKEEIIIDGVDVSKCRYFLKDTEGQDYNTDEFVKGCCEAKGSCIGYEFAGYGLCRGDKDCYFKQLARKTQECEELKKKEKYLYDFLTCRYNYGSFRPMWGAYLLKRFFNKNLGDFFNADTYEMSDTFLEKEKEIDILNQECEKYEQALDTVSEYIKDNCYSCQGIKYGGCEKCELKRINDIITKAKDGE